MKAKNDKGLTLEDVAALADGTGNLSDETAAKLKPIVCANESFAEDLATLRQMADDAATTLLEDGLSTFKRLARLRQRAWKKPGDVLEPDLEVPYCELAAMTGAMAERAGGEEKAELEELGERLFAAFGDQLGGEKVLQMVDELVDLEEAVAEAVVGQLVGLYRLRRKKGSRKP